MQKNFEELQSIYDSNYGQTEVMRTLDNFFEEEQFYFSHNNNSSTLEIEEENFAKSFNSIFSNEKNSLDDDINYKKLYYIEKTKSKILKRKRGRLPKNKTPSYKLKHSKLSKDDIIQKIIKNIKNIAFNYINKLYEKNNKHKTSEPLLRSIDSKGYNVFSNRKLYELFHKKLGDLFSADISKRNSNFLSTHSKDYNKIVIESLIKENKEKNVIKVLNSTLREIYEKYINNEIDGFNFENDLIKIEKKEGKEYKDNYKEIALELIDIIDKKGKKIKYCTK